jgi:phosphoglycolate phosphatase-like HAD superfamily hydrolase
VDTAKKLRDMKKEKKFLICVDSDGCAVNTMEYKHKEYFGPQMIKIWNLEDIKEDVIEVWNFVNLYSQWRGINRFLGLAKTFELLKEKKSVLEKKFSFPNIEAILAWVKNSDKLSNASLEIKIKEKHDPSLEKALLWSQAVNACISKSEIDSSPFDGVKLALEKAQKYADIVVISSANAEALDKEWREHGIASYVKEIAGQEMGSKASCISIAKEGKYDNEYVLMIGDAPGDLKAAIDNNVLYYPIIPGKEVFSWERFNSEAFDKFINNEYKGEYQNMLIKEFNEVLSSELPWQ